MNKNNDKISDQYVLVSVLSGGLTIVTSLTYIVLSILALVFRFRCSYGQLSDSNGAEYFITTIHKIYIQDADCPNALRYNGITQSYSVFIMVTIILCFSVLSLCSSIALIVVAYHEKGASNINIYTSLYIGVYIAVLVVDLTLSVHFGTDHALLQSELAWSSPGLGMNYEKDMIRLGALLFMTIALKGYVIHAVNLILIVLLTVYASKHQNRNKNVHSIHNLGVLNAFDRPKRIDDPWQNSDNISYSRGPHSNSAFVGDDEPQRQPIRESSLHTNHSNRPHDRSNSWHRGDPAPGAASRPFSYLEEPKRPIPVKRPTTPTKEPSWRRDPWPPAPYVPDPDYSPPQSRRLKSALKTGY